MASPTIAGVRVSTQTSELHKIRAIRQIMNIYNNVENLENKVFLLHGVVKRLPHLADELKAKMNSQHDYFAAGVVSQSQNKLDEAIETYEKGIQHSANPEEGNTCLYFAVGLLKENYGDNRAARFCRENGRPDMARQFSRH